jgi:hypothetical protein
VSCDDGGGQLLGFAGMALVGDLGAGIGALAALVAGRQVSSAAANGFFVGLGLVIGWMLTALLVVAVLWARGISPAEAYAGKQRRRPVGRHSGPRVDGWRQPGDPMVPGSLVASFALMTVVFGAIGAAERVDSRPWREPTAVVVGTVVKDNEPGFVDRSEGTVDVRYDVAGRFYTVEIDADPDDEGILREGDTTPIEYAVDRPERARSVVAVEYQRGDVEGLAVFVGILALVGLASGVGYVAGRRRTR